jgi:hypothetical protein
MPVLVGEPHLAHGLPDDEQEVLAIDRLGHEVEGARLHDLDDRMHRGIAAAYDDLDRGSLVLDALEELEPVQALEEHVRDEDGDRLASDDLERGVAVPNSLSGVAVGAECGEQKLPELVLAFDDQNRRLIGHFSCVGRATVPGATLSRLAAPRRARHQGKISRGENGDPEPSGVSASSPTASCRKSASSSSSSCDRA